MEKEFEILRNLIQLVLKDNHINLTSNESKGVDHNKIKKDLQNANHKKLIQIINRHRLITFFQKEKFISLINPELGFSLYSLRIREQPNILQITSLSIEVYEQLSKNGIRLIIFKGIALSIQTTASIDSRGVSADLDVLISVKQLHHAVELLKKIGFQVKSCDEPSIMKNFIGKYRKVICSQLTLVREKNGRKDYIDLHWKLSSIHNEFENFSNLYKESMFIKINDKELKTLSYKDSFHQSCVHSAVDNWMCIRNLIDIAKLSKHLSNKDKENLRQNKIVTWSSEIAFFWTRENSLLELLPSKNLDKDFIYKRAFSNQVKPRREHNRKKKNYILMISNLFFIFRLKPTTKNIIIHIVKFITKNGN